MDRLFRGCAFFLLLCALCHTKTAQARLATPEDNHLLPSAPTATKLITQFDDFLNANPKRNNKLKDGLTMLTFFSHMREAFQDKSLKDAYTQPLPPHLQAFFQDSLATYTHQTTNFTHPDNQSAQQNVCFKQYPKLDYQQGSLFDYFIKLAKAANVKTPQNTSLTADLREGHLLGTNCVPFPSLNNFCDFIFSLESKTLPLLCPFIDQGALSPLTLTLGNLLWLFPVSFSETPVFAHHTTVKPVSFADHDIFHAFHYILRSHQTPHAVHIEVCEKFLHTLKQCTNGLEIGKTIVAMFILSHEVLSEPGYALDAQNAEEWLQKAKDSAGFNFSMIARQVSEWIPLINQACGERIFDNNSAPRDVQAWCEDAVWNMAFLPKAPEAKELFLENHFLAHWPDIKKHLITV